MTPLAKHFSVPGRIIISGAPEGSDALAISELVAERPKLDVLYIARDEVRMVAMADALAFFAPTEKTLRFPAWDCVPYDRISPKNEIISHRLRTLLALERSCETQNRTILVTTCNAAVQRVPKGNRLGACHFSLQVSTAIDTTALTKYLSSNGYNRSGTVMEPGEYAVRGGIIDLYPSDSDAPVRMDLFGDIIESIRIFDPLTQRSSEHRENIDLIPASEVLLDEQSVVRFRSRYRKLFGAITGEDELYESVSSHRRHAGIEHWLPLFHDGLATIFDYLPDSIVLLDHLLDEAINERLNVINDFYEARKEAWTTFSGIKAPVYKPVPPEELFLTKSEWTQHLSSRAVGSFSSFDQPSCGVEQVNLGARYGRDFSPERKSKDAVLFDEVGQHIRSQLSNGRRVVVACHSSGARDRLSRLLGEYGIKNTRIVDSWNTLLQLHREVVALIIFRVHGGFETAEWVVLSELDILGDRLVTRLGRSRRAKNFLSEATNLTLGDIVVHVDHGVGKFEGLETIDVGQAPHDCVTLIYADGDRLYLPVENIEMLGRYGVTEADVRLDTLGNASWQNRKSKVKKHLRDMAEELIATAAKRTVKLIDPLSAPVGLYDEFCARFPYVETEDQLHGIGDCMTDLSEDVPMDRLICGDVGFGKTEVALRAAFVAASSGKQVAIVTPTTLLCRQHYETFRDRFNVFSVSIAQLSRLIGAKIATSVREGLTDGTIDIVVGTHALLSKSVVFKNLGLLVIDEEQHFGVAQKEHLKAIKSDVHVLTLTATPIPRTLQLALSGVRHMSIIATPPIDRLAIRSFILPYDRVVIREAILREHFRGGQIFYVCPRIKDLDAVAAELRNIVPEIKILIAHGKMASSHLDSTMTAFYDGKFDLLLSTSIIESGLDIPSVNTLIVHRADRFGLSQLYQLRGRVGRRKIRAYAYFTVASPNLLKGEVLKRLEVLHKLDSLGAGFSLASHDLDARGAGNLLGEEQSGHIREIGVELYQQLLNEAVTEARGRANSDFDKQKWSPKIEIGAAVLLPEYYVPDLSVRLALYRRVAVMEDSTEVDGFAAELVDRFGPLPQEVEHLLRVVCIKQLCRCASIEQVDAGPKGAVLTFRNNYFAAPEQLITLIASSEGKLRLRPDHKLVIVEEWPSADARFTGVSDFVEKLARLSVGVGNVHEMPIQ